MKQMPHEDSWKMVCAFAVGIFVYSTIQGWELLGFQHAEVFGHVWGYNWRFQDFPVNFFGTDRAVGTEYFPLIDPIPTLCVSVLNIVFSLPTAYILFVVATMAVNAQAISRLIQEELPEVTESPLGQWHLMIPVSLVFSTPILWGAFNSGLTEDYGVFLTATSLILLRQKRYVLSGLVLATSAYWGLVLGWMSGILLGLYVLFHRVSIKESITMFGTSIVGVLPLLWVHWDRLGLAGHRTGSLPTMPDNMPDNITDPMWMLNPWHHTDLASMFFVGSVDYSEHIIRLHPASLGWIAIIVSMGCRDWRWWGMFLSCIGFALGSEIHWMGASTGVSNPFHTVLSLFPGSEVLNHHGRWMLMGVLCWLVIVVKGVYFSKWQRWKYWITIAIICEWVLMTPLGFPIVGTSVIGDSVVLQSIRTMEMDHAERLLRVPVRGPDVVFQQALYEQTIHDQRIWMNPNRPDPSSWFDITARTKWIETIAHTKEISEDSCVPKGVGILLVAEPYILIAQSAFGEPVKADDQYAVWTSFPICETN